MYTQQQAVASTARNRAEQKEQTRTRILEAALGRFAENGILATSTIEVAAAAGVSHGSVFAHFRTRDELVASAIHEFGHRIVERIHDLMERKAGVRDILRTHMEGIEELEAFYARLVMEGPLLPGGSRNELISIQSAVSIHLSEAVEREVRGRTVRSMDLALLFNTWIGLLHHYLANRDLFSPGKSVIQERGNELLNHYMALLSP